MNLAFEFHGAQHYKDCPGFASLEMQQGRDNEKVELCSTNGIKLIVIPYWWDNTLESLTATILNEFPVMVKIKEFLRGEPISKVIPNNF